MTTTKLTTAKFKSHMANQLIESISEDSNNAYYVFMSEHVPRTAAIPSIYDTTEESVDSYRSMILGKRLSSNDASLMIRNVPYVANTVYTMYDDQDDDILTQDFFVIVDEGAYFHVYKCLDNNMGQVSTVEPSFAHVTGSNAVFYTTSDDYVWKYMFSVGSTTKAKFSTSDYFPVVANSTVETAATKGSIDVIKITTAGKRYDNYVTGTFSSGDVRVNGNTTLYNISNTTVSQVNGFYTGCLIYISSGTGSGQYKTVTDYFVNGNGNFAVINNSFDTAPINGSEYQLYPGVDITGDGLQTTNAAARALVNSTSSNSIYKIEILERGVNYRYHSASVVANSVVGVTQNAVVRVIYSPLEGHGSNPDFELGCDRMMFSLDFVDNESNTVPDTNYFQRVGLIKDPLFANVDIEMKNVNGTFTATETVFKINPLQIANAGNTTASNTVIACGTADFTNQLTAGEYVYIKASNTTHHQLFTVDTVINATHINVSSNALWSCTEVTIYQANVSANAIVNSVANTTDLLLSNVAGVFSTDDAFIGNSSGAYAQVNAIIRNGVTKNFDTFVQLHKYEGTVNYGTFTDNEYVYQGANLAQSYANALYHSGNVSGSDITFYTSNQIGTFDTTNSVYGVASLASATITAKYIPEIVYGSGEILYLENIESVQRANDETERVKIAVNF